jgi:anti-sigma-K factor RskA
VQHMDPDQLALLALGEIPAGGAEADAADHLRQCPVCRADLDALRRTVELAREGAEAGDPVPPPEHVWDRIADEVGLAPVAPLPRSDRHSAPVVRIPARRRWVRPVAALVAAAAIGVVGTLGAIRPWQSDPAPATASTATLSAVTGGPPGVTGQAVVVRGPAGPELRVSANGLPLQRGYYEVWVFDGVRNMVALGALGPDSTAALPLPPTLDLRTYHVVDISAEPYDGDQTHSKDSVLRGTLTG